MLKKRSTIALLIASSLFAAQGAAAFEPEANASLGAEPRTLAYDGPYASMDASESADGRALTVFNPDGSQYALIADSQLTVAQPLQAAAVESLPEQLTVFDPDGTVTSYQFTPIEVAYLLPQYSLSAAELEELSALGADRQLVLIELSDPIALTMSDDDARGSEPLIVTFTDEDPLVVAVFDDASASSWSEQVAAFDSALEGTG